MEENLNLVALTPAELPATQAELVHWCDRKLTQIDTALTDLRQNLEIAKRNLWRTAGLDGACRREEKRRLYYAKIKAAVEAGYLIVPNFPVDVFAVRVRQRKPRFKVDSYNSRSLREATPELLPEGEGRYVDDQKRVVDRSFQGPDPQKPGQLKTISRYEAVGYDDDFDFPFTVVKPTVLKALQAAVALKLFDQLALVSNSGTAGDPIVVGQILGPSQGWSRRPRHVTFFLAWWLNTEDL